MKNQYKVLKEFIAKNNPKEFSLWSENQKAYDAAHPCEFRLSFRNMLIHEFPFVIYMHDGSNSVRLSRIKSVKVKENATALGSTITVVCKNAEPSLADIAYTIVAS